MKQISTSICIGLGDNIIARMIFDTVKHEYDEIKISHDAGVIREYKNGDAAYMAFLQEIGNLLFTEPPFSFSTQQYKPIITLNTIQNFSPIVKPNLQYLLCKGSPLNIDEEYICITTKVRMIPKKLFLPLSPLLWKVLKRLSNKYKIVIMGERSLNEGIAYRRALPENVVYGIYDQIMVNLPAHRIIDLTVPSLGIVAPNLVKIQQDGLIMKNAKCVIALGDGGNLWHAVATADKVLNYRDDADIPADLILYPNFTHVKSFNRNWNGFTSELEKL